MYVPCNCVYVCVLHLTFSLSLRRNVDKQAKKTICGFIYVHETK